MKILTVIGTRPEAIKLAPVIRELRERPDLQTVVCVTAQHREMLDTALEIFQIVPDHDLDVMVDNQTPAQVASAVLAKLDLVLETESPDWVLVQGDTTTTTAAGLAAFYRRIKVGHVEAGLRTFDKWRPFPEEVNRRVVSALADLHFAPTTRAEQNLLCEGIAKKNIAVTGNPVIDALKWAAELPRTPLADQLFARFNSPNRRLILVTAHRRENWGAPLENICLALREISEAYSNQVHLVYPVHMNPKVSGPVYQLLAGAPNITLLPPTDYLTLVHLMKQAYLVVTDSGGIQEEAPAFGKPVLVLREITERPEAVEAGAVKVIGTERQVIVNELSRLLNDTTEYDLMARAVNPYGDGCASRRIVSALLGEAFVPFVNTMSPVEQTQLSLAGAVGNRPVEDAPWTPLQVSN